MRFGWPEVWIALGIGTMLLSFIHPYGDKQIEFLLGFVAMLRGDLLSMRREIDGWGRV
jgi:hypothetical protein